MSSLSLQHVNKSFGPVQIIPDASLDIRDGEFIVFVGPSGCGKSTLLRLIAGLEDASSGRVLIGGEDVTHVNAADRGVAMVFQSYALYPHMTVKQNLSFGLENARMKKAEIARRVDRAAQMLQIEALLERTPRQLSGGQRQRVAIGRAITREPKIFLFDEPLSNLDAELRVRMRVEIGKLHQQLGNTMIYVTHDQVEAMTMADRIVVLRAGRVEQVGAPLELFNEPVNKFVAGFIGSPHMNFVEARASHVDAQIVALDCAGCGPLLLPHEGRALHAGQSLSLGVRPEDLALVDAGAGAWPLTVSVSEQHGANTYLHCQSEGGAELLVHVPGQSPLRRGDRVHAAPRVGRWHLFDAGSELRLAPARKEEITKKEAA